METTGALVPTAVVTAAEAPWSNNDWSNPENIYGAGEASVTAATFDAGDRTYVLKASAFDPPAIALIPDGSTIEGVLVTINARYAVVVVNIDLAQLLDTSRAKVGTNQYATPQALTTSAVNYTKGGSADKWGNELTAAWVKDPDFGVAIGCLAGGSGNSNNDVYIDSVTMEIWYTPPVAPVVVDLGGDPAAAAAAGADPVVALGSVAVPPAVAPAAASAVDPGVVLGSLVLSPAQAEALSGTVDPTIVLNGLVIVAAPAAALADALDPAVQAGNVILYLSGDPAQALASGVDPPVVLASLALSPAAAEAIASGVAPAAILGGLLLTPATAQALAGGADPVVVLGTLVLAPGAATAVSVAIAPTGTGGRGRNRRPGGGWRSSAGRGVVARGDPRSRADHAGARRIGLLRHRARGGPGIDCAFPCHRPGDRGGDGPGRALRRDRRCAGRGDLRLDRREPGCGGRDDRHLPGRRGLQGPRHGARSPGPRHGARSPGPRHGPEIRKKGQLMIRIYTNLPKAAWAERRISHDFSDDLATGDTIASIDSIKVFDDSTNVDITATAKRVGSEQIDEGNESVSAVYIGGTPGQVYRMEAKVVTAGTERLPFAIVMRIV
jgi:hypothetical protein